ncbi:hypothetical protein TWF506_004927 [Arthrobotrys conoides]|uniref:Uncharacterized protein n=1 Tax=Arthrobotrys conoides TaxID=74498 RepID=A0AAN8NI77_9PEZI
MTGIAAGLRNVAFLADGINFHMPVLSYIVIIPRHHHLPGLLALDFENAVPVYPTFKSR